MKSNINTGLENDLLSKGIYICMNGLVAKHDEMKKDK